MKPLGIDLAGLRSEVPPLAEEAPSCPGAALLLSKKDYDELRSGGEVFASASAKIPADGYGPARIFCQSSVEQVPQTPSGWREFFGLCHSCSQLEADNRATLRTRMAKKQAPA